MQLGKENQNPCGGETQVTQKQEGNAFGKTLSSPQIKGTSVYGSKQSKESNIISPLVEHMAEKPPEQDVRQEDENQKYPKEISSTNMASLRGLNPNPLNR